jgi:hypothetical protein
MTKTETFAEQQQTSAKTPRLAGVQDVKITGIPS